MPVCYPQKTIPDDCILWNVFTLGLASRAQWHSALSRLTHKVANMRNLVPVTLGVQTRFAESGAGTAKPWRNLVPVQGHGGIWCRYRGHGGIWCRYRWPRWNLVPVVGGDGTLFLTGPELALNRVRHGANGNRS